MKEIGAEAFADCPVLFDVTLPESGVTLGARLFRYCTLLGTITLPEGITELPYQCFWDCRDLMNINIPEGVTVIPNGAFYNCQKLISVSLPDSLTTIGKNAFHACVRLEALTLSANVTQIDETAFSDCILLVMTAPEGSYAAQYALDHRLVPENVALESVHPYKSGEWTYTHPGAAAGMLATFSVRTDICTEEDDDDQIDSLTVRDADGIETEYRGDSLAGETLLLSGNTFTLTLKGSNIAQKYGFRLTEVRGLTEAEYDAQVAELAANPWVTRVVNGTLEIMGYKGFDTDLTIPSHINNALITLLPEGTFVRCKALTDVTLPDTLETIGENAFGESGIKKLTLPAQHKEVQTAAFRNCDNLESLVFPEGMQQLQSKAISGCPRLRSVTFPASVKAIGDRNFKECPNVVIHAPEGSYAYAWALVNHIPVEAL